MINPNHHTLETNNVRLKMYLHKFKCFTFQSCVIFKASYFMLSWSFTKLLCYSNDLKQFHKILPYKELVIQQFCLDTNLHKIDVVFFEPNGPASTGYYIKG